MCGLIRAGNKPFGHYIVSLAILLLPSIIWPLSVAEKETASLYGLIECSSPKHDSITVTFDMTFYGPMPDSIGFTIEPVWHDSVPAQTFLGTYHAGENIILFRAGDSLPFLTEWYSVRLTQRLAVSGEFSLYLAGVDPSDLWIHFVAFTGEKIVSQPYYRASLGRRGGGMNFTAWVPGLGVYESKKFEPGKKSGFLAAYSFGFSWGDPKLEWTLLTSWSGIGKNFSFSAPLQLRASYFPLERYHWSPFILGGGNLSKVKVRSDIGEYREVEWGGEIGVGLTDGLDRLTYTYSTPAGGYHTIELFVPAVAYQWDMRVGSYYLFKQTDDLWMFEMGIRLEGSKPDFWVIGRDLRSRCLPVKVLGVLGALPYLPIYLVARLVYSSDH